MSSIKISELRPVGSELFQDNESFLNELNDQDMTTMGAGGDTVATAVSQLTYSQGISIYTNTVVTQQNYTYTFYY